ncbi:MAG: four helix bundle protein [Flavobacteriales bacterium]|nr:four helix bundle protein [Flavobacteriales bacterium]
MVIPNAREEGPGRGSKIDFARFVQISVGSAAEAGYLLLPSHELGYVSTEKISELSNQIEEIKKRLSALLRKLKSSGS